MSRREQVISRQFRFVFRMTAVLRLIRIRSLSDEDLPTAACARDRRQVIRIRDVPLDVQVVGLTQICDTRRVVWV